MKKVFKYTFASISEYKKFILLSIIISILSFLEMYPVISIIAYLIEKIIIFSVGAMLIYLLIRSKDPNSFYNHIKIQPLSTFLLHFLPTAMGIILGNIILLAAFLIISYLVLYFTNSLGELFLLLNPHNFSFENISSVVLFYIAFVLFYSSIVSYIYLGKLGAALEKDNFKDSFLTIVSSAIDYKYLIKSFNKTYFVIFLVWSLITFAFYSFSGFVFNLYIYPILRISFNIQPIIFIIILSISSLIINYFTFISAFFANKSID